MQAGFPGGPDNYATDDPGGARDCPREELHFGPANRRVGSALAGLETTKRRRLCHDCQLFGLDGGCF